MNKLKFIKNNYFGKGELKAFFGLFGDVFSKITSIILSALSAVGFIHITIEM